MIKDVFEDIVDEIKDDIQHDRDLRAGKDIRPYGSYTAHELKQLDLGTTIKALKMSWDNLTKEQEEFRQSQMLKDKTEENFKDKVVAFYKSHKRSFVVGFNLALAGVGLFMGFNKMQTQMDQMLNPALDHQIVQSQEQQVYSKEEMNITEMENPVVEIGKDGQIEGIHEKEVSTEQQSFADQLKEEVRTEESLSQEELEKRAGEKEEIRDEQQIEIQEISE